MSILFVGTGTNLKTGKSIVFRIHDKFGLTDPKRSIGQLERNILIDRLTDTATGERIEGSQSGKIQDLITAVDFESKKRAGLIEGGEALSIFHKIFVNIRVDRKLSSGDKQAVPYEARKESDLFKAALRQVSRDIFATPVLGYCKDHGQAISPDLESALMTNADISKNPTLKEEYAKLYGMYVRFRNKSRK